MRNVLPVLVMLIVLLVGAGTSFANTQITLVWNANTTDTDLAGHKVYMGQVSGVYDRVIDTKSIDPTYTFVVEDGVWFYAVTAYDTSRNESAYSDEITDIADSTAPEKREGLKVISKIVTTTVTTTTVLIPEQENK